MSNSWPPQQDPPPQVEQTHRRQTDERSFPQYPPAPRRAPSPYSVQGPNGPYGPSPSSRPLQPPSYDEADSRYGGYGMPGPPSAGRPGEWPPQRGEPWPQWGGASAPRGAPSPYRTQDPYSMQNPYAPYGMPGPYDPYGQYGPYDYGEPAPSPRWHNWLLTAVGALVVFAILVVFALIRFAPAATTVPTTAQGTAPQGTATSQAHGIPAGFHVYTNTTVSVQFDIPDSWTIQDQPTVDGPTAQANSPDGAAVIAVAAAPIPSSGNVNLAGGANGALAGVADSGIVNNKEGPTNVTFGGATWVREAGDLTRAGVPLHGVVFVATHGTRVYFLIFFATIATFAAADAHYFQTTIYSFQFLS
jgi:hypothetical protein